MRRGRWQAAAPWAAAGCLAIAFALAYAGKAVCLEGETGFWGMTRYCYSDVRILWNFRGFDVDALPYAGPPAGYVTDYMFEYPPGMALPAYLIGLLVDTQRAFFNVHAVTFAVAVGVGLWALDRAIRAINADPQLAPRSRWRTLGLALSPGLVLFGLQNWDLWPVGLVSLGLAAAARHRPYRAAAWFGLGAAAKWWPALLVVLLVAGPWMPREDEGRRHRLAGFDWRPAAVAAAVWAAVQVPAVVISPSGWWTAIRFHLGRPANLDSAASALATFGNHVAPGRFWGDTFKDLWTVASFALLLWGVWYIADRLRDRRIDPGDAALALVGLFLLTSKVFSPQFIVWLLPVAVVARVRWTPVLGVEAANAGVWLLYGPWMAHHDDVAFHGFLRAAQGMSVVRALTAAWLVSAALWHDRPTTSAWGEDPQEQEPRTGDRGDEP